MQRASIYFPAVLENAYEVMIIYISNVTLPAKLTLEPAMLIFTIMFTEMYSVVTKEDYYENKPCTAVEIHCQTVRITSKYSANIVITSKKLSCYALYGNVCLKW